MKPAHRPQQRPPQARLLVIDAHGGIRHAQRSRFADFLQPGDLVVGNDAVTLPAGLFGMHEASGAALEVRLAGRRSLAPQDFLRFTAVVFGAGDFRLRTEDRPLPPPLAPGERLLLGPLTAIVERQLGHPRLLILRFEGSADQVWSGLAAHGHAIQYAHLCQPLRLWDVWTPIAGLPAAFEPPSAGFVLDWRTLAAIRARGADFATITHAAGISSTGSAALDRRLPLPEPYRISAAAADAIAGARARAGRGRVIAVGTTVVRALEHAARRDGCVRAGESVATQRIGPGSRLRIVDAILSGTHEIGTTHYQLLQAFANDATLAEADRELQAGGYRTHEFGDSVLVERMAAAIRQSAQSAPERAAGSARAAQGK